MSTLAIPDMALVALVGASGAGKSTFARRHFAPTQILSSDAFRGMVGDDENDQSVTPQAFAALHAVAAQRLTLGRVTVVDATNTQPEARAALVTLAREHHVLPVAIVLDVPEDVCVARNAERPDRTFGTHVVRRHRAELRRSLRSLAREGFRRVHVLRGVDEIESATVSVEPLLTDKRALTGPFDVIGDVHGCLDELVELLGALGWDVTSDERGPVGARHPEGRTAVFVGDLVDRGPATPGVLRLVMAMVTDGAAISVCGNHEQKLARALRGRDVRISHGLAESLAQLARESAEFRDAVLRFCDGLLGHYVLDGGRLVVAHAGLPERFHGRASAAVRDHALYGDTTGETDEYGLPVRHPWAAGYRGAATVLYGHTPVRTAEWVNNTMCVDTGVVFGGALTALRYPEREVVSVPARRTWFEPVRPVAPVVPGPAVPGPAVSDRVVSDRDPETLQLGDVVGKRQIETSLAGAVTVREGQAAAALEVMGRFAVDPRWLLYLPPTMPPAGTSALPGLLEHPQDAYSWYRSSGVTELVCEEKHMGSRAVLLVTRDGAGPHGAVGDGVAVTRTGRPFFGPELTGELLRRLRSAIGAAGLWDELDVPWLLLDAEILPWNVKAGGLIRERYASVGAVAEVGLSAAADALAATAARGVDVSGISAAGRDLGSRLAAARAFRAAYRPYCRPTDGLDGVGVAPFQLLAAAGTTFLDRPHDWHLARADRLHRADPNLITVTRNVIVDLTDEASCAAATEWWERLTGAGGEGMVVKPLAGMVRGVTRVAQPGVKVRGPEYLRIVYGPEYPLHLDRLRGRRLGRKRALAIREYALGVEALDRVARGEPLWRVHECVFGVLALESEEVDARL